MDHLLPEWAQPFGNPDAANDYWDLICEMAAARWGNDVSLNYLAGKAEHSDGRVAQFHNIAQVAAGLNIDEQRLGIYNLFAMFDAIARTAEQRKDWAWAAPRLRCRLQANWHPDWELISKPIDAGTQWIVALDHDDGCAPAAVDWLTDWGVSEEEVWRLATKQSQNPLGLRRRRVDSLEFPNGEYRPLPFADRLFCFEGDLYTSGIAADLTGRFQKPLGEHGALLVAPTAHRLYVLPITDIHEVPTVVVQMMVMSMLRQQTEPNPVSNSVLWYRGPGQLEPCMEFQDPSRINVACRSEPLRSILRAAEQAA